MFWYLFFVVVVLIIATPIKVRTIFNFNILNMSGNVFIGVGFFRLINLKVKIKNSYIYITKKGVTYKEKLTPTNVDVVFVKNLIKEIYFRTVLINLKEVSNIGVENNAMQTSLLSAVLDVVVKATFAKIKNNKKLAHIFVENSAKYSEDCLLICLTSVFETNLFDMVYTIVKSKLKSKGEKYERIKQREQNSITD